MKNLRFLLVAMLLMAGELPAADKHIVLIAGKPSHPPGMHEFHAGLLLLQQCLAKTPGVKTTVYRNGWPETPDAFDGADAVVLYCDGGDKHPAIQADHREILRALAQKGVGLGFMHYGVEIPAKNGGPEFLQWIGGYYETNYSCNPMWSPDYQHFPDHPVARGVQPFSNRDEWYFNMRWPENTQGLTPILSAQPSTTVRGGPYVSPKGPYAHIIQAEGRAETMMWVYDRPHGGRGFGFTGGHTHLNWGDDNQRKVVLNALLWIAQVEVPIQGVVSTVTAVQLAANLDPKPSPKKNNGNSVAPEAARAQ